MDPLFACISITNSKEPAKHKNNHLQHVVVSGLLTTRLSLSCFSRSQNMKFFDRLAVLFLVIGCCTYRGVLGDAPAKATGCKPLYGVTYDPFALSTEDICVSKEQVCHGRRWSRHLTSSVH